MYIIQTTFKPYYNQESLSRTQREPILYSRPKVTSLTHLRLFHSVGLSESSPLNFDKSLGSDRLLQLHGCQGSQLCRPDRKSISSAAGECLVACEARSVS
jgi:hypothetical protein